MRPASAASAVVEGGGALSGWWVQHFESHMRVILDGENGPFHAYAESELTTTPQPLPFTDASESPLL